MKKEEVFIKLVGMLKDNFYLNDIEITEGSRIMEDLGISSFDAMLLIPEIETSFAFEFSIKGLESIVTVGDLVEYIWRAKEG